MTASRPNVGFVLVNPDGGASIPTPGASEGPRAKPPQKGLGLRVEMKSIPGITGKEVKSLFPFRFQAPPLDELARVAGANHTEYETISAGQFSRFASRRLKTMSFPTLFVDYAASWGLQKEPPNPLLVAQELEEIAESGEAFRLQAHQAGLWGGKVYDVNWPATLREVQVGERAGEVDARYVTCSFVEFRHPEIVTALEGKADPKKLPVTLTVKNLPPGRRTMSQLAKAYYGSASKWRLIAKKNGLTSVSPSTDLRARFAAQPARKLTVPKPPKKRK